MLDVATGSMRSMSERRIRSRSGPSGFTDTVTASCGVPTSSVRTMRPTTMAPSFVCTALSRHWSLTAALGSMIARRRSVRAKRPPTPVRSGPLAPPSPPKRWHWMHMDSRKICSPRMRSGAASAGAAAESSATVHAWIGAPVALGVGAGVTAATAVAALPAGRWTCLSASSFTWSMNPRRLKPPERSLAASSQRQ